MKNLNSNRIYQFPSEGQEERLGNLLGLKIWWLMHNPGKEHWQAVKWILRYIQKTLDVGLIFKKDDMLGQHVVGYCDSDYAGDLDKRRSTTGYVFSLAKAAVSWKSTLQSTVALSTTEAEYMAITEAVKEAIWLQGLRDDLGVGQKHVTVFCDS